VWWTYIPESGGKENYSNARGDFARDGAGRSGQGGGTILGALGFAPMRVDQIAGRKGRCSRVGMHAAILARGSEREIDLIEEVARVYASRSFRRVCRRRARAARLPQHEAETRLRERLIGLATRDCDDSSCG